MLSLEEQRLFAGKIKGRLTLFLFCGDAKHLFLVSPKKVTLGLFYN